MTQFFGKQVRIGAIGKLTTVMLSIFLFISSWMLGIAFSIIFLIYKLGKKWE